MKYVAPWKLIVIAVACIGALISIYPTVRLALLSPEARAAMNPEDLASLKKRALPLGLDLMGGMYLRLEVAESNLSLEERRDAIGRALEILRNRIDPHGTHEPTIQREGADRILIQLPGLQDADEARSRIRQTAKLEFRLVEPGLETVLKDMDEAIPASVRLAEGLGAPEEETTEEGAGGAEGAEAAGEDSAAAGEEEALPFPDVPLGGEALEDEEAPLPSLPEMVFLSGERPDEAGRVFEDDYDTVERLISLPEVRRAIPRDRQLFWGSRWETTPRGEKFRYLYLLNSRPEVEGAKVRKAEVRPDIDRPGTYEVTLKFTRPGSRSFYRATRNNVGRRLAIVLDGRVNSAPEIQSPIPGDARITGGFSAAEAKNLKIVLEAGALPVPLKIIEERTVGPSLGADSIRMGVRATLWGGLVVLLFMAVYYRMSGLIADLALLLNLLLLLAIMIPFDFTLTMPGIAGIVLTVGMAVDANVLIFERIREELRQKKTPRMAIENGYRRATVTILDANITTLLTALVLYHFGTAAVKGFAVTLGIGLVVSMFTALLVTRVIFDAITGRRRMERLSI